MQTLALWLAAAGMAAVAPNEPPLQRFEFLQIQMGIPFEITVYAADEAAANKAVRAAYARVKQLNGMLSDYDPDSELNRLCQSSGPGKPVKVSPELLFVLQKSLELSKASDGAFDVTIGPVVDLWRRARRKKELPNPAAPKAALERVGYEHILIDEKAGTVELRKENMRLDLGGIAKGYAADEALRVLREHGVARALCAAAGDIVAGDPPPGEKGWRVGIAPLEKPDGPPSRFLSLANRAVSTSGDAFQSVEIDGTRYSHIVDPQTGLGLTTRSSVTVVAPKGITSDSVASAVSVLGRNAGLKLVESMDGVSALFVAEEKDGLKATASSDFPENAAEAQK